MNNFSVFKMRNEVLHIGNFLNSVFTLTPRQKTRLTTNKATRLFKSGKVKDFLWLMRYPSPTYILRWKYFIIILFFMKVISEFWCHKSIFICIMFFLFLISFTDKNNRSDSHYFKLLDHFNDFVFIIDTNTNYTNKNCHELFVIKLRNCNQSDMVLSFT